MINIVIILKNKTADNLDGYTHPILMNIVVWIETDTLIVTVTLMDIATLTDTVGCLDGNRDLDGSKHRWTQQP